MTHRLTSHPRIVTRHAEDAAFYWARRMEGSLAPQHDLRSLGRFETLLQANLEGLQVAQHESSRYAADGQLERRGSAGWDATFRRVQLWKTADETFVAATLALQEPATTTAAADSDRHRLGLLEDMACEQFDRAGAASFTPMALGLASAASWLPWSAAGHAVRAWALSDAPVMRRSALSALSLHRVLDGAALARWLRDPHPLVRERALRAVGELGRAELADELVAELRLAESAGATSSLRSSAAWSLCLLGHAHGIDAVPALAEDLPAKDAAGLLAAWAQVAPAERLWAAAESASRRNAGRVALTLMRYSGQAAWLDILVQWMEHECSAARVASYFTEPASNLARLAADVFAHISGARIGEQLWRHAPEPDDQADAVASDPLVPAARKQDPDDGLLWPDVEAVKRWWVAHRLHFAEGGHAAGRHLAGLPLTADHAARVLVHPAATQLQRRHAALHLRCTGRTPQLFDVRAALPVQRQQAAALGLVLP